MSKPLAKPPDLDDPRFSDWLIKLHARVTGNPYTKGGTVTQATSKATTVALNVLSGEITLNNAALAAGAAVTFTLTNAYIAAGDLIHINHVSAGTAGAYSITAQAGAGSASITVRNLTAGSLSEAIVLRFAVIKVTS